MRSCSISSLQRLSSVLRFFAEGGYQHGVGKDFDIPMAQSTFCGVLKDVLHTLQCHLCPQWVNLDLSNEEKRQAKMDFYQKYGFPGAILCVDGTHIKIVAPAKDKFLYFNRKGYYSINAMIVSLEKTDISNIFLIFYLLQICDNKMRIRYVNAQYPGSNHDAHIWNVSSARNFFENKYLNGERNTWLLGDAGYALEPWLMTPFRSPTTGSAEGNYNKIHAKARNTIERTIGVFKNRFRCLLGARELYYEPMKVCQIVNVAAALHNICMHYRVVDDFSENVEENHFNQTCEPSPSTYTDAAIRIRESISSTLTRL
ncbi:putative nuclease HARBI1 isoform X1 [Anastrepha ludens]|uniref:putative nuclease HARBI1 isoform X1 n=1 Tax=Anastrepha ludens TaxID=28586 RepID=UPI0023AF2655|nr:putative nuclease HARBI1 isoform X1 [Anastrepha ludens]